MKALRNAALDYADRGWKVIPLRARGKEPLGSLVPHGKDDATDDLVQVLRWWTEVPRANVGIVCGPSGLVVIDVDPRSGGDDSLHELERRLGRLPETVSAETGGGGWHYVFRHPGVDLVGVAAPGLDVKDRGYIVASPSIHPSGRSYAWDLEPDDVPLADLPHAWVDALRPARPVNRDLELSMDHDDPLRCIPAETYVARLSRREVQRGGWVRCPFHGGGAEQAPSLNVKGTLWACYGGCQAPPGKQVMGGNVYDFAALIAGYAIPLRGPDFVEVQTRLRRFFRVPA
jgi:hypothetical protein